MTRHTYRLRTTSIDDLFGLMARIKRDHGNAKVIGFDLRVGAKPDDVYVVMTIEDLNDEEES